MIESLVETQQGRVWATSDATGVTIGFTLPAGSVQAAEPPPDDAKPGNSSFAG